MTTSPVTRVLLSKGVGWGGEGRRGEGGRITSTNWSTPSYIFFKDAPCKQAEEDLSTRSGPKDDCKPSWRTWSDANDTSRTASCEMRLSISGRTMRKRTIDSTA